MDGKMDEMKGRAKEAAGDIGDDDRLQREGKADQAGGKAKQKVGKAKDKAGGLIDKVKDRFK